MLARVYSYQTTDGKLHATKAEALTAQFQIDIRAIIQSNSLGRMPNITPTDVAVFILTHAAEVSELLRKYKEQMRHATPAPKGKIDLKKK